MSRGDWEAKCSAIKEHYLKTSEEAASLEALEELQIKCLGRKGELTELLKALKDFSLEDKKLLGPLGNSLKETLSALFEARKAALARLETNSQLNAEKLDITLPAFPVPSGRLHPLTLSLRRMADILKSLGFSWAEGPLIENEFYNFDALNTPTHHPSRDQHDTIYVKTEKGPRNLMRTHTSPIQVRYMKTHKPPLRAFAPGRAIRNDSLDASHSPVFHQIEGFYVDKNVSMADLKYTLTAFMGGLFGPDAKIRFRPSYFSFVEPGVEVDVKCVFCKPGEKCPVCKSTGWIEMLGAGMIHPNVLKAGGLNPDEWRGFAFGMGVERLSMLLYGISDIRTFYENDLRILKQF
ncbi:MAG: phenylalanine--tRNA ligase subunit alpha [Elusimicrobiaceae bacterium]|jgi:phenylalanyl-tRNA synthetase alpha chain